MIDIEKLKLVVSDPLNQLKYYHGDVQRDLYDVLDTYYDNQNLVEQLDDAEATVESLNEQLADSVQEIRDLEAEIERIKNRK